MRRPSGRGGNSVRYRAFGDQPIRRDLEATARRRSAPPSRWLARRKTTSTKSSTCAVSQKDGRAGRPPRSGHVLQPESSPPHRRVPGRSASSASARMMCSPAAARSTVCSADRHAVRPCAAGRARRGCGDSAGAENLARLALPARIGERQIGPVLGGAPQLRRRGAAIAGESAAVDHRNNHRRHHGRARKRPSS